MYKAYKFYIQSGEELISKVYDGKMSAIELAREVDQWMRFRHVSAVAVAAIESEDIPGNLISSRVFIETSGTFSPDLDPEREEEPEYYHPEEDISDVVNEDE